MRRNLTIGVIAAVLSLAAVSFAGIAVAAKPVTGVISVPDVQYAGTTTATVNPAVPTRTSSCSARPGLGGKYVYAAYFPVDFEQRAHDRSAVVDAMAPGSRLLPAQEGYFTRNGFGRWSPWRPADVPASPAEAPRSAKALVQ